MKRHLLTMTVLFLLACGAVFGQSNSAKTEDEKAIRANVEQIVNGWNMKSGAEFAQAICRKFGLRCHQRNAHQRSLGYC